LIIAPVFVPGINDSDIEELIMLSKKLKCRIGIQNYLEYKRGKRPEGVKAISMDEFYARLKELERKHYARLILSEDDFLIKKTEKLKPVFRKGEIITAEIKALGKIKGEVLAVAKERVIQVRNYTEILRYRDNKPEHAEPDFLGKKIKAEITRIKHNIYYAVKI
jgi:uncharacterized Fe-S cluster-containing radical SAM superfamily enzyme